MTSIGEFSLFGTDSDHIRTQEVERMCDGIVTGNPHFSTGQGQPTDYILIVLEV